MGLDRGPAGLGALHRHGRRWSAHSGGNGRRQLIQASGGIGRGGPFAFDAVDRVFREESGRVVAGLIRAVGDFDLAEESVQDAFVEALEHWPRDGLPPNPGAWIATTARRKANEVERAYLQRRWEEANERAVTI